MLKISRSVARIKSLLIGTSRIRAYMAFLMQCLVNVLTKEIRSSVATMVLDAGKVTRMECERSKGVPHFNF